MIWTLTICDQSESVRSRPNLQSVADFDVFPTISECFVSPTTFRRYHSAIGALIGSCVFLWGQPNSWVQAHFGFLSAARASFSNYDGRRLPRHADSMYVFLLSIGSSLNIKTCFPKPVWLVFLFASLLLPWMVPDVIMMHHFLISRLQGDSLKSSTWALTEFCPVLIFIWQILVQTSVLDRYSTKRWHPNNCTCSSTKPWHLVFYRNARQVPGFGAGQLNSADFLQQCTHLYFYIRCTWKSRYSPSTLIVYFHVFSVKPSWTCIRPYTISRFVLFDSY